ncbi:S1 RNA-binding domain-containing protein [Mycobacterium sp. TNTM28]|uniref:S1 RNA-binding domain-containing protein n=1 Tax=[Mycobacterium] fortunisiensis TaxID=2600579 RepID=A0ABS6KN37_9MYCO|nr:S1 RNA-binding domain-containing protein [[Mycobacterium] fortunisiensis]
MSSDVLADAARKYAHMLPGHMLLAAEPAAVPASLLTVAVLVEAVEDLPATHKYALTAILNGITTMEDLTLFLGLDTGDIGRTIAELQSAEYVDYQAIAGGGRRLELLPAGLDAARDAQLRRPRQETITVPYDRLTGQATNWPNRSLRRASAARKDPRLILLPPAHTLPVQRADITAAHLTEALQGRRRAEYRILGVSAVTERPNFYYDAIVLIYKDIDSDTVRIGVEVDGQWSAPHLTVLDDIDAVGRLGITSEPAGSVPEVIADPTIGRLGRDEVIALQTALDGDGNTSNADVLDRAAIRWLPVHEHPKWLLDAITNSKKRLMIISPWINRWIVDHTFIKRIEQLARTTDVTIFWGYGDNSKSHKDALNSLHQAANRSQRLAIVRLDDTHAKVIISDSYYIKTSFNWLSFAGSRDREYRQEEGTLVRDQVLADDEYDRLMTDCCGHALDVIGTLPHKYRHLVADTALATTSPSTGTGKKTPNKKTGPAPAGKSRNRRPRNSTPRGEKVAEYTVGQTLTGTVKRLEEYGAFVALGNADGLIHKSRLAKRKVGHPSEIVKVGQSVNVIVVSVDADKGQISLALNPLAR